MLLGKACWGGSINRVCGQMLFSDVKDNNDVEDDRDDRDDRIDRDDEDSRSYEGRKDGDQDALLAPSI